MSDDSPCGDTLYALLMLAPAPADLRVVIRDDDDEMHQVPVVALGVARRYWTVKATGKTERDEGEPVGLFVDPNSGRLRIAEDTDGTDHTLVGYRLAGQPPPAAVLIELQSAERLDLAKS